MKRMKKSMSLIRKYLKSSIEKLSHDPQVPGFIRSIIEARRVFVYGLGKSGFAGKGFAMRLKHLKIETYAVGETTTPAIKEGDLLIIISGSGSEFFEKSITVARNLGAKIAIISQNNNSILRDRAKVFVDIPTKTEDEDELNLAPMGTLFEDITQIFLDGVVAELMYKLKRTHRDLKKEHANLEG